MNNVSTIIFDLGEVLVTGMIGVELQMSEKFGIKIANNELNNDTMRRFFKGEISENDLWKYFIQKFKWNVV